MEHRPAGDQHLETGSRSQELCDDRGSIDHLLKVVEEQQELSLPQVVLQTGLHRLPAGLRDLQCLGGRHSWRRRDGDPPLRRHEVAPVFQPE